MGSYLSERNKILGALTPANVNTNSGGASKPFKLDQYQKGTIIVYFAGPSSNFNVLLYKGNTTTVATAMAFNYILTNGAAAYCEVNGTLSTATNTGVFIENGTYPTSGMLVIEVNGQDLGTNYHFVGINTTGSASNYCAGLAYVAILSDARYPEANPNHYTVIS